jgi:AcrR family transcriptional regulator
VEPALRRAQILSHAAALFGRRGYHATSIADIIKAAGVARGTFYLYFRNKRAIFDEILDMLVVQIKERITRVDISDGALPVHKQMVANIQRVLELFDENRALLSILLEGAVGLDKGFAEKLASFYDQITHTIEGSLRLGQEMGIIRPLNTRAAALSALGGLKEVLHDTLRSNKEKKSNLRVLSSEILDIFMRGVAME